MYHTFTNELLYRLCLVLRLPATPMFATSEVISSSFLTTMQRSVVGQCQPQSKRAAVVSSPRKRPYSCSPLSSVRNISRTQMRKSLISQFIWTNASPVNSYHEQVERGKIKISLTNAWPAILYDESMTDDNELSGLFRSETLLRVGYD